MKTLLDHVFDHERDLADRIWLTQPTGGGVVRDFTWREAMDQARRMAAHLRALPLEPGSRIAILSKNCAWWFLADLATWMAGHVSVPVYPTLTADSVRAVLEHSGARVVFVGKLDQFAAMEPGLPDGVTRIAFPVSPAGAGASWDDIVASTPPLPGRPNRDPDELVTIMYTSGSTGQPKGVMHSFRTMDHSRAIVEQARLTADDRFVSYLPLAHVAERALLEATSFLVGFRVYFVESLQTFLADVQRARPTIFGSVPRLWMQFRAGVFEKVPARRLALLLRIPLVRRLVRRRVLNALGLDHARVCFYGSAPSPPELIEWYRGLGLELLEIYGMTEGWAYSHMGRVGDLRRGWVGQPVGSVQHRLSDEGEVLVKTPGLMLGFYNAPDATREMIDEDGWLHTGDSGSIDPEGFLWVEGRRDDVIVTGGENVVPEEVEEVLAAHPDVAEAAVVGRPDPDWQNAVVALVVPRGGSMPEPEELRSWCGSRLAPHKVPKRIELAEELPRTSSGKLRRADLRGGP